MSSKKWTGVWDGLWTLKHYKNMKSAIYLFGFYLSRSNKNGIVKITDEQIAKETEWELKNIKNWKQKLKKKGYISVEDKGGSVITIAKFRPLSREKSFPIAKGKIFPYPKEGIGKNLSPDLQNISLSNHVTSNKPTSLPSLIKGLKDKKSDIKISGISNGKKGRKIVRQNKYSEDDKGTANFILSKILY